jgi:outer membrane immunogenic protein
MTCVNTARARRQASGIALLTIVVAAPVEGVRAADLFDDFTTLRGSASGGSVRWDGFQLGGTIGYVGAQTDFSNATRDGVKQILRQSTLEDEDVPSNWPVLGSKDNTGRAYGGFIGYNWQLDSIVVGVDAAYNYTAGITTSDGPTSLRRVVTLSDGTVNDVRISGRASLTMHDYATLRARAGYPMGQFMPYAFFGAAVGRFDYSTRTTVRVVQDPSGTPSVYGPFTERERKTNAITAGFTTGLGVDIAILPNMYLRAEYEFNAFLELAGIRPMTHTGRVGLGFRF